MANKKILHFSPSLPPDYSGAGRQAQALYSCLLEEKCFEFHLACYSRSTTKCLNKRAHYVPIRQGWGKIMQFIHIFALIMYKRYDLIHLHGYVAAVLLSAKLLRIPVLLKTTLDGVDDLRSLQRRGLLHRFICQNLDAVVSLSPRMAELNNSARKNLLIPNGIDLQKFSFDEKVRHKIRKEYGFGSTRHIFLYCGGDSLRKGFLELEPTWRKVCNFLGPDKVALFVVGRFSSEKNIAKVKEMVREFGNVYPKYHVVESLKPYLDSSDVLLFLSSREGLPNAVLEAAVNGLITFVKDIPGTYDHLLNKQKSVLFDDTNLACLQELRGKLQQVDRKETGLITPEALDINDISRKYITIYQELLST